MNGELNERDEERMMGDLEKELRKFGTPYVSPEPDERYWSTFRLRAMERIEQVESRKRALSISGIFGQAKEWIAGHVVSTGLAGAALASLIAVALLVHPFNGEQADHASSTAPNTTASKSAPSVQQPVVQPPSQDMAATTETTPKEHAQRKTSATGQHDSWMASKLNAKKIGKLPQMASADESDGVSPEALNRAEDAVAQPTIIGAETEGPVSLNDLNSSQLESVYEGLKSEK